MAWRAVLATALTAALYLPLRKGWPSRTTMRIHLIRGAIMVPMSLTFFWGLARVPMAQAIALAFIAPLLSLFLAAILIGEKAGRRTATGSLVAFVGVIVIFVGQARADLGHDALMGSASILVSAMLYAFNIVLMRRQALAAGPIEIAFFQFLITGVGFWLLALAAGAPAWPAGQFGPLLIATLLAIAGMLLLAVAYARAGAAYLSSSEYSGFIWAAIFGWLLFDERVSPFTLAGAALIVGGCWIAARSVEHPGLEVSA
jgi:S-adenosylmethionine uptake transporter